MHSDGDIAVIMPDLVEIGLTVFNPVQPEVTDHAWLRQTFGSNLAYYGGVSTQTVMPFGTPDAVRTATRECARNLAPNNTGLLIAPSHRMLVDIPMANVEAFMATCAELRFDHQ
jgi:uroporphyrinogen decarboxylase